MTTWAVTGGRDYTPSEAELRQFLALAVEMHVELIIHGNCEGVDAAAGAAAKRAGFRVAGYSAKWRRPDGSLDRSAGPRRNARLIAEADGLFAFKGGRGTADCTRKARVKGIPVVLIGARP